MLDRDPSTPDPYERGDISRAELARQLGVSERHLRRLHAQERARRQGDDDGPRPDDEPPYVAITDDPDREKGHWYHLESGECSLDHGKARIGGGGQGCDGGPSRRLPPHHIEGRLRILDVQGGLPASRGGWTRYDPTDDLKGGKDT